MLHWVCSHQLTDDGAITIYCDNIDLITMAHDVLHLPVKVTIKHHCSKGHYKGKKAVQYKLNYIADELVTEFNTTDRCISRLPPMLPQMYEAELLTDNYIITSRLTIKVTSALHDDHLRLQFCTRNNQRCSAKSSGRFID